MTVESCYYDNGNIMVLTVEIACVDSEIGSFSFCIPSALFILRGELFSPSARVVCPEHSSTEWMCVFITTRWSS